MAFKISLVVILLLLVLTGSMLYRSHLERLELISVHEEHLNEIAEATIHRRFRVSYEILNTGLFQILANPAVVEAFALGDRDLLYETVAPSYENFEKASICRFHFHLPGGESFLRVHQRENYGDSLLEKRPMIQKVNAAPEEGEHSGMERGGSGTALRAIAPIFYQGEFIGSVELGMCLGPRILDIFKNVSGGEWFLYDINAPSSDALCGTREESKFPTELTETEYRDLLQGTTLIHTENSYVIQKVPLQNFRGEYSHYLKREFDNSELIALQSRYTLNSMVFAAILSLLGLIFVWLFVHRMLRPLTYLEKKARSFEAGTLVSPIEVSSKDEIGVLAKAMETMRKSLISRESSLKEMSYKDQLTGVYNRRYFHLSLENFHKKKAYPISIIIGDVDGLKTVNDQYGHSMGDEHIKEISRVLGQGIRTSDVLSRLGGDEFGILLPKTPSNKAKEVIKRIEALIREENVKTQGPPLNISFGHSVIENESTCPEKAMDLADQAMYHSKSETKKRR